MKVIKNLLIAILVISFVSPAFAQDAAPQGGVNLKVGENFYFEGDISSKEGGDQEESMAEIQRTPFYKSTWFITAVSIIAVAGASTGVYFLTRKEENPGNTVNWQPNTK